MINFWSQSNSKWLPQLILKQTKKIKLKFGEVVAETDPEHTLYDDWMSKIFV